MEEFNKKSLLELKKLGLEELEKYQQELRKYEYDNNIPLKGIELRKKIHKLLLSIIKIDRVLSKESLSVIGDKRKNTNKPVIYACTHIGGNDIQRTFEAIDEHAYLFLGDPKDVYRDFSGLLLYLNGVICFETYNKEDRKIAYERSLELLRNGGNLLIYPEGAWNITENLPVLKPYLGTVKMAMETGAEIVPVAIEQYGQEFLVNIGDNMIINASNKEELLEENNRLRDNLATLKWEIWEKRPHDIRSSITDEFRNNFEQSIVDKCEYGFTVDDVYKTMYKDPNEVSEKEVFAFRKKLSH